MSYCLKISAYLTTIYFIYKLSDYLRNRFAKSGDNDSGIDLQMALFFPEDHIQLQDCYQQNYDQLIANNPKSHLCQLMSALKSCHHSLDVCMYCLSFEPLIQLVEDMALNHEIVVRIIINGHKSHESVVAEDDSSQRLRQLFRSGIESKVITLSNEGLMHSKYAIIDNNHLIVGSLNWTQNSIFNCYNDCIITSDTRLVLKYIQHFNKFWSIG